MTSCAVPGCEPDSSTDFTFHRLPSSPITRSLWISALGPLPDSAYICSRHFEETMFTKDGNAKILMPDAVPQLFLDSSPKDEPSPNLGGCSDEAGSSGELVACRVCLAADGRLYAISGSGLEDSLAALTGVALPEAESFPRHLCAFCRAKLSKCAAFRDSCQRSTALLQTLLERGPLKMTDIKAISRNSQQLTNNLTLNKAFQIEMDPLFTIPPLIKTENDENAHQTYAHMHIEYLENEVYVKKCTNDADTHTYEVPIEKQETSYSLKGKMKPESPRHKKVNVKAENTDAHSEIDDRKEFKVKSDASDFETDSSNEAPAAQRTRKRNKVKIKKEKPAKCPRKRKYVKKEVNDCPTASDKDATEKQIRYRRRGLNAEIYSAFDKKYNCKTTILSKEEQKREIEERNKTSSSPFTCDVCGKGFKAKSTLMTHKTYHDPNSLLVECDVCLLRFRSRRALLKHQNGHRTTFTCNDCGHVSRHRTHAKDHALTHQGTTYNCPYCQKEYNHQTSYYNHIRVHHPGKNEACDECGETFAAGRGMLLHKARAHKQYGKPKVDSKCTVCEVTFLTHEALKRHLQSSVGVSHAALWPCAACGESCGSDAARAAHAAEKHPPAAQHYCKECDKTFSSAGSFALHVDRKHNNQRVMSDPSRPKESRSGLAPREYPCVCEICGKRYSCLVTLQYHMNVHLGLKPFKCAHCPKAFPHKTQVRMHMRVHTGERPYQCEQCPQAFSRPGNYARHVQNVHLRMQAKCDQCGKVVSAASLAAHVRAVHMNIPYVRRNRDRTKKRRDLVTDP